MRSILPAGSLIGAALAGVILGGVILGGAILGGVGPAAAQSPTAPIEIVYEAPIGHRQPTLAGTAQAASAKDNRSASDVHADEAVRRSERELRDKLIICRSC